MNVYSAELSSSGFAENFVSDHREGIKWTLMIAPLFVEISHLAYTIFKKRREIPDLFRRTRKWVVECFTRTEGETNSQTRKKFIKNTAATTVALGAIGAASAVPLTYLHPVVSVPTALFSTYAVGKTFLSAGQITCWYRKKRQIFTKAVQPGPGENLHHVARRYAKNLLITAAFSSALGAGSTYVGMAVSPFLAGAVAAVGIGGGLKVAFDWGEIRQGFVREEGEGKAAFVLRASKNLTIVLLLGGTAVGLGYCLPAISHQIGTLTEGDRWPHLTASETVITLEYACLGAVHLAQSLSRFSRIKVPGGLFHILSAALAFGLPRYRVTRGREANRLHHDFLGLFLQTFPLRPAQALGTCYLADSMLYDISRYREYDFSNLMLENCKQIIPALASASVLELISESLGAIREEEEEEQGENGELGIPLLAEGQDWSSDSSDDFFQAV